MNKLNKYNPEDWGGLHMVRKESGAYINIEELKEWLESHMRNEEVGTIYIMLLKEIE